MAIKIVVADKVGFTVAGVSNDADGNEVEFDFKLTAKRLKGPELIEQQKSLIIAEAKSGTATAIAEILPNLITNWSGPRDESDAPLAYSPAALTTMLENYSGMAMLIWRAYLANVGAKAKN